MTAPADGHGGADLRARIRRDADQCVMCGLCLPHCPTYLETREEGDSPRGRVSLISALAAGRLPLSAGLERHLDGCLGCRACEAACPSRVPYGALIDAGRSLIGTERPPSPLRRWLADPAIKTLLSHPAAARTAVRLGGLARTSGLAALAARRNGARWPLLGRMQRYLMPPHPAPARLRPHYPVAAARGRVALFAGCAGPALDGQTVRDAVVLLNRLGYAVDVPRGQACCGALHQHTGDLAAAWGFARRNLAAFHDATRRGWDAVLFLASGCGATLKEYPQLPALPPERREDAVQFAAVCQDINAFLAQRSWGGVTLRRGPGSIAVHDPCSMTRVLRGGPAVYDLLQRLPDSAVQALDGNRYCCGAAGSYMLTQPAMADRLLGYKVQAVRRRVPDVLLTTNVGCALHLRVGLFESGSEVPVMHPVSLLARHLA